MGGVQGVGDELGGIGGPLDDVDLLVLQFFHHFFHAVAAGADAGAHGVDGDLGGMDGHLGAAASFPGDGLDLYHARSDLRHFHLEQALHQSGMNAADANLRPVKHFTAGAVHFQHIYFNVVVDVIFLAGHIFAGLHDALGAAQLHIHALGLHPLHDGGENLVLLVGVFLIDAALLRFADPLHDDLLGGLGGGAQEAVRGHVDLGDIAHPIVAADLQRFLQRDLIGGILHIVGDGLAGEHVHVAGIAIHGDGQVAGRVLVPGDVLFVGGLHGLLNRAEENLRLDILFGAQRLDCVHDLPVPVLLLILFRNPHCLLLLFIDILIQIPSRKNRRPALLRHRREGRPRQSRSQA